MNISSKQMTGSIVTVQVVLFLIVIISVIVTDFLLLKGVIVAGGISPNQSSTTYSAFTRFVSENTPILAWVWGIFAGRFVHFGRSSVFEQGKRWVGWTIMIGLTLVFFLVPLIIPIFKDAWAIVYDYGGMTVVFGIGYAIGMLFWPVPNMVIDFINEF